MNCKIEEILHVTGNYGIQYFDKIVLKTGLLLLFHILAPLIADVDQVAGRGKMKALDSLTVHYSHRSSLS